MVSLAAETVVNADGRARMLNPMLIKIRIEDELRQKKFKDISSKKFAVLLPFNVSVPLASIDVKSTAKPAFVVAPNDGVTKNNAKKTNLHAYRLHR